ncbi:hypothetical protein PTI98_002789 [Pleurotus ostreatus]|nr:hypothetical protein PTI98_002789 [Pleurotus ostreatus]
MSFMYKCGKPSGAPRTPSETFIGTYEDTSTNWTNANSVALITTKNRLNPLKNYGQLAPYDYYVEHYKNPWASDNHVVAFNPWNVKIIYLQRIRIDILQFFRELIYYVFTPEFRRFIDSPQAPSDMRHYFYHHCAFFRFLDYHIPLFQGFSCECIHPEVGSSHTWTERQPNPPRNPLLTAEEDEFLHHISEYFEYQEVIQMANTCRHLPSSFMDTLIPTTFSTVRIIGAPLCGAEIPSPLIDRGHLI